MNERHAGRKASLVEKIREEWRKRGVSRELKKIGHTPDYVKNIFEIEKNIGVKYSGEMDHSKADTGKVNPKYNSGGTYKMAVSSRQCNTAVIRKSAKTKKPPAREAA